MNGTKTNRPWHIAVPFFLLLAAAFALYAGSFGHAWTYDDFPVLVNNPDIRSLADFWRNHNPGRPLRELTYLLDYRLFGLKPAGYHLQNIFWHGLNAGLLLLFVRRLGGSRFLGWASALIFLAHPLQVEVVANISHRKDSLALAFILLALLAYQQATATLARKRLAWLGAALLAFGLACAAKQNAVVLPLVAVAYDWAFVPAPRRLLGRYRLPWLLLGLGGVVGGLYWYLLDGGRAHYLLGTRFLFSKMSYDGPVNEWVYGLMLLKSWVFMGAKVILPGSLALEYTFPVPKTLFDPWVLAGLALLTAYGCGLWFSWRRARPVFFWLCWVGLFWLPTSNLWPLTYFAADRYLYTPLAGLAVLFGLLLAALLPRPALRWGLLACCVLPLVVLSWRQDRTWQSPFTLWSQAVKVSPDSVYALNNLGAVYGNRGDIPTALKLIGKAAENPYYQEAQLNMARIYERLGQTQRAALYYQRARNPHAAPAAGGAGRPEDSGR